MDQNVWGNYKDVNGNAAYAIGGPTLELFRNSLNLTRQEFADSIEVSKSLYEKVETGQRKPSRNFIEKLKRKYPQFDANIFYVFK